MALLWIERSDDRATGEPPVRQGVRPQVDPFRHQRTPVDSICGPLAELGRRSCGADVAGWLNATVPVRAWWALT